jgi:hypothetical protein
VHDEAGANGVALDIPEYGQQVLVRLDGEGLVPALPDAAARPVTHTMTLNVRGEEPMHDAPELAVGHRPSDEMDMVRHEAPRKQVDAESGADFGDQRDGDFEVVVPMKDRRARVPARDDVGADAGRDRSSETRHGAPPKEVGTDRAESMRALPTLAARLTPRRRCRQATRRGLYAAGCLRI